MSDLQKTIEIIFAGEDQLSGPMNSMAGNLTDFSAKVEAIAAPFAKAADAVIAMDTALTGMTVAGLAYAIKSGGDFTAQLNEINTMAGLTGDQLGIFGQDVINYAKDSTQSFESINNAIYQALSLGNDYETTLNTLRTAEELAVAGKADLTASLELLLGTMNSYGAGVEEAGRYSDTFFTIVQNGKTTIPELAASLSQVTGVASSAGIPIETLGSALAALTAAGAPTSQAITQIKALIEGIIKPTSAAATMAEELGIEFGVQALAANGLEGVLQDVWQATGGNVEAMAQLFTSSEALQGVLKLGADSAGIFAKSMVDMGDKTGAVAEAYAQMVNNIEYDNQRLLNNIKAIFISIGLSLEDERHNVTVAATNLFAAIGDAVDAGVFDEFFKLVEDMGVRLADLLNTIARNLPEALEGVEFDGLIKALQDLGGSIGEIFDDVDLSSVDGLERAIQVVIDSLTSLVKVTEGMADGFKPFIDGIYGIVHSVNEMDDASKQSFGELIAAAKAVTLLGPEVAAAIIVMGESAYYLALPFEVAVKTISGAVDLIKLALYALVLTVVETADKVMSAFELLSRIPGAGALKDEIDGIRAKYDEWRTSLTNNMEAAADSAAKNLTGIQTGFSKTGDSADKSGENVNEFAAGLELIPSHKQTDLSVAGDTADVDHFADALHEKIPEEMLTNAKLDPDQPSIDNTEATINGAAPPEKKTDAIVTPNMPSIANTQSAINEIPESKLLEIELQGDIDIELAEIEARADMVQTAFEWTAKVNVAEIEAGAKMAVAAFDSVGESVTATAAATADMFSSLLENWDSLGWVEKRVMEQYLQEQMAMEQQALDMQQKLIDAQVEYMQAKADALRDGEGLIKISSDGLEPALEMIMWQIMEKVQLRVNEESAEFLLGLGTT